MTTELPLTANQRLDAIREKARLRQRKFYNTHKPEILQKKKDSWKKLKLEALEEMDHIPSTQVAEHHYVDEPVFDHYHDEPLAETVTQPSIKKTTRTRAATVTATTTTAAPVVPTVKQSVVKIKYDIAAIEKFYAGQVEKQIISKATEKMRLDALKSILFLDKSCSGKDFKKCFKNYSKLFDLIDNGYQKKVPGEQYSTNSKLGMYTVILNIIDFLPIDYKDNQKIRNVYFEKMELLKIEANDELRDKINSTDKIDTTMPFDKIMTKVEEDFGRDSKQYLLIRFYDVITCRDDYAGMIIAKTEQDASDNSKNYVIVPENKTKPCKIYLNVFHKTTKKYPSSKETCNKELSTLIRSYIEKGKSRMKYGSYLFGKGLLSGEIGLMLRTIKVTKGAINYLRHSKITTELDKESFDQKKRYDLSQRMKHSPVTQLSYLRQMDKAL